MPSTIYDIRLRYTMEDRAGRGLDSLEGKAARAAATTGGLGNVLGKLGAIAAGGFGIQQASKRLVGFNASVEDTKLQIGGMLALTKHTDLTDELRNADRVFGNLQKRAKLLPGTTREYAHFAGMITQPIIDAGLGMRDLEDLTVNSVVAAKALGEEAGVAARDIDQALRGMFRSTDPFAGKVLGSIGYKGEEGRSRFNALSQQQRAAELKRALMQKQWGQLAAAQGQTFNGMLSTFQDNLEQLLGKVGLPLFKAITNELKQWNAWAEANSTQLEAWAKDFGESLVDGFRFVKDAIAFLVEHKDELIAIGKVWLAMRIGQGIGGMLAGAGGLAALGQPVSGFGGAVGAAGPAFAAGMIGWQVGRQIDEATGIGHILMEPVARLAGVWSDAAEEQDRRFRQIHEAMARLDKAIDRRAQEAAGAGTKGALGSKKYTEMLGAADVRFNDTEQLRDELRGAEAARAFKAAHGGGGSFADPRVMGFMAMRQAALQQGQADLLGLRVKAGGAAIQTDALIAAALATMTADQKRQIDMDATTQAVMSEMVAHMSTLNPNAGGGLSLGQLLSYDQVIGIIRAVNGIDPNKPGGTMKAPGKVNVTIQRIEVKSDDPDRMAFGLVEFFRDVAKNPSGAAGALREG